MKKSYNKVIFILFILIVLLLLSKSYNHEHFDIVAIKGFNNNFHSVRNDFHNTEEAANLMAHIKKNINILVNHLNKHHSDHKGVSNINERLDLDKMMEAEHEEDSTSYTINKGEEIHLCMREKNKDKILHDVNTMMFVILHEMAHIMSDSIGHNTEFMNNFKFILKVASEIDLYDKINYSENPQSYCGIKINSTPIKF